MARLALTVCTLLAWPHLTLAQIPCDYIESDTITASDSGYFSDFGTAVDISGTTAVVGAPRVNGGAITSGAAYVYDFDPITGTWIETARLVPSVPNFGAFFGTSVAIGTDRIVVGAPFDGTFFPGEGAVFLFDKQPDGSWLEVVRAVASDMTASDEFGTSVDISDDDNTIVVGAPSNDLEQPQLQQDAGAIYIFEFNSGTGLWTETQFFASNATADLRVGEQVALDGNTIAVGSYSNVFPGVSNPGVIYIFEQAAGVWAETTMLTPSGPQSDFSQVLDLSGDTIVAGNDNDDVYVFQNQGSTWTETQRMTYSGPRSILAVAIRDDRTTISTRDFSAGVFDIEVHDRPSGTSGSWSRSFNLIPSGGSTGGTSPASALAISDDYILAGDEEAQLSGAILVYQNTNGAFSVCPSLPSASAGSVITLSVDAGTLYAGDGYIILGSTSGSLPGFDFGGFTIPLNIDGYFNLTVDTSNSPIVNGNGALDSNGQATGTITLSPNPSLTGTIVHHVYVIFDTQTLSVLAVGEAVPIQFLP